MTIRNGGEGREEQFAALYRKYYLRILRFYMAAFRLPQEEAEELTQDAFVKFFKAIDEYRGDAEWAYFEAIARNIGLNRVRSRSTAKRSADIVPMDAPGAREVAAKPDPDADVVERHERDRQQKSLYDEIDKLSPAQRQCLMLWLEDMKYEEIASVLKCEVGTVKVRVYRAMRELSDRFFALSGEKAS